MNSAADFVGRESAPAWAAHGFCRKGKDSFDFGRFFATNNSPPRVGLAWTICCARARSWRPRMDKLNKLNRREPSK